MNVHNDNDNKESVTLKTIKKIKRAIKIPDSSIAYYKLRKVVLNSNLYLDRDTTEKIYKFMVAFKSSNYLFDNDFDVFMHSFLIHIQSESPEMHLCCLSLVVKDNLDEIRTKFSYTKIYNIFKYKVKNIFTEPVDYTTLHLLIQLLNNSTLIYKQFSIIIERINIFLEKSIVDKSIIECCVAINSFDDGLFEVFNDVFTVSLLAYLVKFIYQPKNFLFIELKDAIKIIKTIEIFSRGIPRYTKYKTNFKKVSFTLLTECISKINEFKKSTVYEEVMVVVCMTDCLTYLFGLAKEAGNDTSSIIPVDFLQFIVFDRSKPTVSETNFNGTTQKIKFERPFKSFNSHYQVLRDTFIKCKYTFIDTYHEKGFFRIEFLNDLSKIENPKLIFSVIKNLKKFIEWSDLIVFACNAPSKESYISFIFDKEFIKNKEHFIYLDLFLINIRNDEKLVVYFTSCAIKLNLITIIPKLYLLHLEKNTEPQKKTRSLIIEYINSLDGSLKLHNKQKDSIPVQGIKGVMVEVEKLIIEETTVEKIKKTNVKKNNKKKAHKTINDTAVLDFDVDNSYLNNTVQTFIGVFVEELSGLHINLVPLLIVLTSKKIHRVSLKQLLDKILLLLQDKSLDDRCTVDIICILSILCRIYKYEYFLEVDVKNIIELLIATLAIDTCNYSDSYIRKIKEDGFTVFSTAPVENIKLVLQGYVFKDTSNFLIKEYMKIVDLLVGNQSTKRNSISNRNIK